MPFRFRAIVAHLVCSAFVACAAWLLVFGLWYAPPLSQLAGGTSLFLIIVGVDVVVGPALTGVVANARKPRAELFRDIAAILALQLAALGYGLYTLAQARPVAVAFEADLFRVITLPELDVAGLSKAPDSLRSLPWTGPRIVAAPRPADAAEQLRTIELGLAGVPLAALPQYWREYGPYGAAAWRAGRPLEEVVQRTPRLRAAASKITDDARSSPAQLRVLPLLARRAEAQVVLAGPDGRIVGYLPAE